MMLTDLAAAARASGLRVVEQAGWQGRGHGGMAGTPRTVVLHHTAGPRAGEAPSLGVVTNGRADLAGPLSHLVLGRSGTVYVVAAGLCWHAGATWTANQSNSWAIGIEAEATGVDPWPPAQYDAYLRLVRALCDHYRIPHSAALGHKEVCTPRGRKSDPNFDCNTFRAQLGGVTAPAAPAPSSAEKKVKPVIITQPLVQGDNYIRLPAMVGAASGLYSHAWVSISGELGGDMTVAFQKNAPNDGPPPGAGKQWGPTVFRNASRVWQAIPDGTEYIECWVKLKGRTGFVAVEFQPK